MDNLNAAQRIAIFVGSLTILVAVVLAALPMNWKGFDCPNAFGIGGELGRYDDRAKEHCGEMAADRRIVAGLVGGAGVVVMIGGWLVFKDPT